MNKQATFDTLRPHLLSIILGKEARDVKLAAVAKTLDEHFPHYNWTGFYLADPESDRELVLGPFVGEATDHTRIKYGVGICGQVAESLETFVVEDVTKEENYLACSPVVKSEIVVPILVNGEFVGQLDIDSHFFGAMDNVDKKELEWLCEQLASLFEAPEINREE